MRRLIAAAALAATAVLAGVTGYAMHSSSGPWCPTEDSCAVTYQHGAWHITPEIP